MDFPLDKVRHVDNTRLNVFVATLSGASTRGKYGIFDDRGQQLYSVFEGKSCYIELFSGTLLFKKRIHLSLFAVQMSGHLLYAFLTIMVE